MTNHAPCLSPKPARSGFDSGLGPPVRRVRPAPIIGCRRGGAAGKSVIARQQQAPVVGSVAVEGRRRGQDWGKGARTKRGIGQPARYERRGRRSRRRHKVEDADCSHLRLAAKQRGVLVVSLEHPTGRQPTRISSRAPCMGVAKSPHDDRETHQLGSHQQWPRRATDGAGRQAHEWDTPNKAQS